MTGIMPREECALGIDTGTTREIAILSRVGKPVSFQVLCIRGDVAYVSRRRAQQRAFEQLLHKRPGDILPVRVTHLEPFGAFVDAGCGLVSLIGIENLSVSRIFHPSDRVQVGQQLYAVLSGIDADTGRISLTHRELLGTWAENAAQFAAGETVCGIVRSIGREGQTARVLTLAQLERTAVDMFTTVYIGNASTKQLGGRMVTPRGYRR